ncbi:MAG: gamma-glutamyltransferase, partial [Henriciella sp.]
GSAPVTVPGTVEAWGALHEKFGRLNFNELLEPTIRYAREGAPIPEVIAFYWGFGPRRFEPAYESGMLDEYDNAKATYFSPAPREGSLFRNPDLANTLERIAYEGPDEFYTGETAHIMGDYFERIGGALRFEDFAAHDGEWVEPLCVTYRDEVKLCELPPNTQGVAALQMLQILEPFDLRSMGYGSADSLVAQVEAKRLAFADRARGYADPAYSGVDPSSFINAERNASAKQYIDLQKAQPNLPEEWTGVEFDQVAPVVEKRVRAKFCDESGACQEFEGEEAEKLLEAGSFTTCNDAGECMDIDLPETSMAGDGHRVVRKVRKIVKCDADGHCTEEVTEDVDLGAADKKLEDGDTTYLTVTDKDGMMVSLIQSNYRGMGSGLVADGLGFMFQDRGQLFSLDPAHPNVFEPGKRPFHTIIPAFAFKKDLPGCQVRAVSAEEACPYEPWMSFGLMGGGMQPQGHVQIILNLVDFDMGLQEAGDAARWEHTGGCEPTDDLNGDACESDMGVVNLESGIPPETRAELERRGFTVECCQANGGGYQAIMRDFESGAWIAATEMRKDGQADGY